MTCRLITVREDHAPVFSDFDSVRLAEIAARPLHDAGHKVCAIDLSCGIMTDFSELFRQEKERADATLHIDLSPGAINARVDDNAASAPDRRGLQASGVDIPFQLFLVWAGAMALICLGILVLT